MNVIGQACPMSVVMSDASCEHSLSCCVVSANGQSVSFAKRAFSKLDDIGINQSLRKLQRV